ncbi:MAG: alpha/beta fold hydrolase, partial [Polyangiaceae bacterium]|nr:alpha/beta fold hydrolase [Polyangiaceae bacterium]
GSVLRCASDGTISRDEVQARLDAQDYVGRPLRSGARMYRIQYETTRATGAPGYSAAAIFLPDNRRASKVPAIVVSHGSRGQAGKCAPSLVDPSAVEVNDDQERAVLTMVGAGFPVIAPDLAGFAGYGSDGVPPSGYNSAEDGARSTLDAARAVRSLLGDALLDQVVLTGHSQGGHLALSSLALAERYAPDVNVGAVATFVPNWLTQRTWAALFALAGRYTFTKSPTPNAVSIWYHYTQAELLDGPGGAAEVFGPDKLAGVKKFVDETCWGPPYPLLEAIGTILTDVFSKEFTAAVMGPATFGSDCAGEDSVKAICEKWMARYQADRPHLTGKATEVPILINYGGKDDSLEPARFQCGVDRLLEDGANLSYCFLREGTHGELPAMLGDYTADWIANQILGERMEASCPSTELGLVNSNGKPVTCATPPPND